MVSIERTRAFVRAPPMLLELDARRSSPSAQTQLSFATNPGPRSVGVRPPSSRWRRTLHFDRSSASANGGRGDVVLLWGLFFKNNSSDFEPRGGSARREAAGGGGHHGVPVQDLPILQQAEGGDGLPRRPLQSHGGASY